MSDPSASPMPSISLEQLAALNEEIAALARAGVPLNDGLLHLGRDMPGKLGRIATLLGQRLQQGENLLQIVEHEQGLPPAYRAVVAAGIRSGRLSMALEGITGLLRRASESRWLLLASLAYPACVLVLAYLLFVYSSLVLGAPIMRAYREFVPDGKLQLLNATAGRWMAVLGPELALLALIVGCVWWLRARSATALNAPARGKSGWASRPTIRNMISAGRLATFADLLALLLEQDVPMDQAVVLAAQASGDRRLEKSADAWAKRLRRGQPAIDRGDSSSAPPVLAWLLRMGADQASQVRALRRTAESYRRRAAWIARWLSIYLPMWTTVILGGAATAAYAVAVVGPWCQMLYELAKP